ncbi:MAG: DUF3299 domain-containing protein [Deltaproteobacteria bacterium]|jgi:hypothetical protein|nr:DUF3299 domain-containing protein [Deltaproteobacteria bacterium]
MRRALIAISVIVLLALPMIFQPGPSKPQGYKTARNALLTPESVLAQAETKTKVLEPYDGPSGPSDGAPEMTPESSAAPDGQKGLDQRAAGQEKTAQEAAGQEKTAQVAAGQGKAGDEAVSQDGAERAGADQVSVENGSGDQGETVAQSHGQTEARPGPEMAKPTVGPGGYLENGWLIWEELMPAGWDPVAILDDLNINDMADDDPRIDQVIDEFLRRWNDSPTNPEINAKRLKIPGFVVPLDFEDEKVDEFFLVPFFGACIHVPPPPPNQIILVRLKDPIEGLGVMEVVWVYGKISLEKVSTDIGSSGYSLSADRVEFYRFDEETG